MKNPEKKDAKRCIRPVLLILLWVWAICIFMVVDLFKNVDEFDEIRPRARIYRAMRYAAHEMIGESYDDGDFGNALAAPAVVSARTEQVSALRTAFAKVHELQDTGSLDGLAELSRTHPDARVRISALQALLEINLSYARERLLEAAADEEETIKVRKEAARSLGRSGPQAVSDLERLIYSTLPKAVREGAVVGLGHVDSAVAVKVAVEIAEGKDTRLRPSAVSALKAFRGPQAAHELILVVSNKERKPVTRAAACHAFGESKSRLAVQPLCEVLVDGATPAATRAAAVEALGKIGDRSALQVVAQTIGDASTVVARQARVAKTRLEHVREQ